MDIFLPPIVATRAEYAKAIPVADFVYQIAEVGGGTHVGDIEARMSRSVPFSGGFDDAVKAAFEIQKRYGPVDDVTHRPFQLNQVISIQEDASGKLHLGRLDSDHRERIGPVFIDGKIFDDNTRSLKVTTRGQTADGRRLLGVVGHERVLDFRNTNVIEVINDKPLNPTPPRNHTPTPHQ